MAKQLNSLIPQIDQYIPVEISSAQRDFEVDENFKTFQPGEMVASDLAFNIFYQAVNNNNPDFIFINEPILISKGENSDVRYNFYYPRWAYDRFRELTLGFMNENGLKYFDFWDIIPESEFTNSAIHLTFVGEELLASKIKNMVVEYCQD